MPKEQAYNQVYVETDSETEEVIDEIKPADDRVVFKALSSPVFMAVTVLFERAAELLKQKGYFDLPVAATMSQTEMAVVYLADALGNGDDVRHHCKVANQSWFYNIMFFQNQGVRFFKRYTTYFESLKFLAAALQCEEEFIDFLEHLHQSTTERLEFIKNHDGTYGDHTNYFLRLPHF